MTLTNFYTVLETNDLLDTNQCSETFLFDDNEKMRR